MSPKEAFLQAHPSVFFLDPAALPALTAYLQSRHWILPGEEISSAEPAGGGNMNCTLRVETARASLIVKQARPWVEKYPHIEAPWDRALVEADFYQTVQADGALAANMPRLIGFDADARIIALQDLGAAPDFTSMYRIADITVSEIDFLLDFLIQLHSRFHNSALSQRFANTAMRELNHEHIFSFPLRPDNGLDLDKITPGLSALAESLQQDTEYRQRVADLGLLYLGGGRTLIHGDYFPGSWLRTAGAVKIIDPEFCFFGLPEIDLGTMIAHLHLARCCVALVEHAIKQYGSQKSLDLSLTRAFAGVEIMRRLLGVAQLPLPYGLDQKEALLHLSKSMVMNQ